MPLQNPKYEQFAQGLAEGKPAYQAYIDAGFAKVGAAQSCPSSGFLGQRAVEIKGGSGASIW